MKSGDDGGRGMAARPFPPRASAVTTEGGGVSALLDATTRPCAKVQDRAPSAPRSESEVHRPKNCRVNVENAFDPSPRNILQKIAASRREKENPERKDRDVECDRLDHVLRRLSPVATRAPGRALATTLCTRRDGGERRLRRSDLLRPDSVVPVDLLDSFLCRDTILERESALSQVARVSTAVS